MMAQENQEIEGEIMNFARVMALEDENVGRVLHSNEHDLLYSDMYVLLQATGVASGVTVYCGRFHPIDSSVQISTHAAFVAVKVVNLDQQEEYNRLNQEVRRSGHITGHNNIVGIRDSFIHKERFCVVMPYMDRGSLRSIMSSRFPYGLPQECIAVALRESLIGLSFLHGNGHVHRDINVGHIFLYRDTTIQLAFAATVYEHNCNDQVSPPSVLPATTICSWAAAPEVYSSDNEYTPKADIWLIGITALELGYGELRVSNRAALEVMIKKMIRKNRLPKKRLAKVQDKSKKILDHGKRLLSWWRKRKFTKDFQNMVLMCLAWDAAERPTADQLLQNSVFREAKNVLYFEKVIEEESK